MQEPKVEEEKSEEPKPKKFVTVAARKAQEAIDRQAREAALRKWRRLRRKLRAQAHRNLSPQESKREVFQARERVIELRKERRKQKR